MRTLFNLMMLEDATKCDLEKIVMEISVEYVKNTVKPEDVDEAFVDRMI